MAPAALKLALAGVLAGAALAAAPAQGAPPAHRTYQIKMTGLAFGPAPTGLRVGDTIEWVNADLFRHTATARDKSFDVDLMPGARAKTVLKAAGAIAFYCKFHPGMTGTLVVKK